MTMASAIGGYEDWPAFMAGRERYQPANRGSQQVAAALGVPALPAVDDPALDVSWHGEAVLDGVRIRQLTWRLPFGPPTTARFLTPEHHDGELPGLLWMHCHGGNKWQGGERLVDYGPETDADVVALQQKLYEGRAIANDLARAGFAVLVHDTFSWGTRRFELDPPPARAAETLRTADALWSREGVQASPELRYNTLAGQHENTLAKASALLGTSYAGMVAYEDLTALSILRSLPDVDADRIGTGGFSGGGGRALIVSALAESLRACVVSCMMTTHASLFPAYLESHSWLLSTPGLAAVCDWPDLTSLAAGTRFLVQYAREDALFPVTGMQAADRRLQDLHQGIPGGYRGEWHPGGHVFDTRFLTQAIEHFRDALR